MTLTSTLFPTNTLLSRVVMVLLGSVFLAAASQISVPMVPVPISMQTLAVLMVGYAFGARMGAMTVLAYLTQGALGLPVFASFGNGAAFFGPTAGFLVGFVGMAYLAGMAADRGIKNVFALSAIGIVISALLYIPGVAWPMAVAGLFGLEGTWVGISATGIWQYFMQPFLLGDAIKAIVAAMVVTGAWAAVAKRAK